VGKNRILWTSTYLSVFVYWFLSGVFAQAATFTVNSSLDVADANPGNGICETAPGNGTCTLRAAIQETNSLSGADEIILPANTYLLTNVSQLSITSRLTITGSGASSTIIDGNKSVRPDSRVLVINSGITVNITGVTIRNGGTTAVGGGIFNGGTLTLTNSTVSGNTADNAGGGIFNNAGTLTLINSIVSGNNAGVDGGGIRNDPGGTVTLTNSTVSGNTAGDDAGGIHNVAGGTLTLTNSTVSGNDAGDDGGGIRNSGTANIVSSTIANNRAGLNSSPNNLGGGGVHNFAGTLTLTNSTVSGNVARTDGGGIFIEMGTVNSFSSTIANNRADANSNGSGIGGGVYNLSQQGATFNFKNTIIANNQVGSNPNNIRDCAGTLTSQGYNLIRIRPPGECNVAPVTGDLFSFDPILGPLQNNGGSTQTHALLAGSPAIDAGNPNVGCVDSTGPLPTDQRGLPRAFDGNGDNSAVCDIGAFELNDQHPSPAISISDLTVSEGNSGTVNVNFQITLSAPISQPVTVTFITANGTAVSGTDYEGTSGTVTFNPGETSKTITVLVDGDTVVEGNETFFVNLTSATNGIITDAQGIGTIVDDDVALRNISTRSRVLTGDSVMIGGFIIEGSVPKRVLVRSRGPSMAGFPFLVPGTLANPFLQLFSGQTLIAQNNNWQDSPNCSGFVCEGAAEIISTGLDPCQPNPGQSGPTANCSLESAILITLPPGAYTGIVTGADGGTGVALVEVFEADASTPSDLSNISTRAFVQTGDNVMIGGLIIEGNVPATVLIRARGPSMSGAPFFVPGTLANPFLQLFSGQTVIAQNDNWQDAPSCNGFVCGDAAQIVATGLDPCQANPGQSTPPPGCTQESAILITLPPGGYTAIISGVGGGTGVGLVEAFETASVP
jgi:CSLREA domain-containing protein